MADPQTADQGFLAGLLGKFGADPAAAYGGLLSDPATQRQFALRSLGAAAQAFGQGAMPVPYKGGIPFGATLGAAGGAASTAGDELIKARLEQAQADLAQQQGLLAHANVQGLAMNNSLYPVALGLDGKGGTGTGTDGKLLTGPAKILAGNAAQGGGIGAGQLYGFLRSFDYPGVAPATPQEASFLTGNAKIESNFNPDTEHDAAFLAKKGLPPGYGLWGDNANRLDAMRKDSWVGPTDNVPWQQQAIWQLQELRKSGQGSAVNAAKSSQDLANLSIDYLRPDTKQNDGFRAERRDAINTYLTNPPDAQTASTGDQPPAAAPGSQVGPYAPVPGQPPPQGVYVPPGASPNAPPVRIEGGPPAPAAPAAPPTAPPAASRGLLDTSQGPLGSSAAPPQLATPPAAGAPGPVTGLLGQQPAQQVAAADAPQLSPAAAAVLQGINRQQAGGGLLASGSVAGGNAVPTGGPSPAAVAQAGPPHTGAAGAAELAGLLAQQPPPQAPAAGPIPPAAAPAPAPAPAGPMPPAPGGAPPPGVAPPMPPPAMPPMPPQPVAPVAAPGPIAGAPTDRQVAAASIIAHNNIMMGKAVPPDIAAILNYKYAGPTAAATAAATAPITQANAAYDAQVKAQYQLWVEQNKPQAIREAGMVRNPQTGQLIYNPAIVKTTNPTDGSEHSWYSYPSPTPGGIPTYQYIGMSKVGPGTTTTLTQTAGAQPIAVGNQVTGTGPGYTQPLKTADGSFLPPANTAAPITGSKDYLDTRSKQFADTEDNWGKSVGSAQEAMQRTQAIMTAMKLYQTGAFATDTSDLVAALKAAHIDLGNKVNDPAQAQIILKDAFGQALSGMQATGLSKWTQAELFGQLKNLANPDLQPAANREIGAQTIGTLQWEQQMQKDFARYKQFSPGINDPTDFQRRWVEANPLQPFIDKARTQIGPLKGETPDLPAGAVDTGRTYQGKPIYNVPDGKGGFKQQVLH